VKARLVSFETRLNWARDFVSPVKVPPGRRDLLFAGEGAQVGDDRFGVIQCQVVGGHGVIRLLAGGQEFDQPLFAPLLGQAAHGEVLGTFVPLALGLDLGGEPGRSALQKLGHVEFAGGGAWRVTINAAGDDVDQVFPTLDLGRLIRLDQTMGRRLNGLQSSVKDVIFTGPHGALHPERQTADQGSRDYNRGRGPLSFSKHVIRHFLIECSNRGRDSLHRRD
jgi:hypothetical protein